MIAPEFERFILEHKDTFLTEADKLAVLIDTHNINHAKLLLSQISYSRIPVLTEDNHFVGTISLQEIAHYQYANELSDDQLEVDIATIVKKDGEVVHEDAELADILRKLIDESFLPVVDDKGGFQGIITRKSILKTLNTLLHSKNWRQD